MRRMRSKALSLAGGWLVVMVCLLLAAEPATGQNPPDPVAAAYKLAASFDFGAFCVEDIPVGSVTHVGRPDFRGNGVERSVTLRFGSGREAKVYFFENSRPEAGIFDACGDCLRGAR